MARPNILYIHSHDTGRYIQPYGHAVATPNLQRLAEEGVLFRQAFCAAPTCSASRAALLTGQCAHSSGMIGLAHRGFSLNDYDQHVARTLKKAGYTTALSGVQHVAAEAKTIGYDRILGERRDAELMARQFLEGKPSEPFFLSVGFFQTHRVYPDPGPDDDPRYVRPPDPIADTPETRRDMAGFHTSVRDLDRRMGVVFDALAANGLAENTLVICTTDHGLAFPWMKCNLTDHGTGVMLILRGPGGFAGGKVVDAMVSHIDVFPTLCELLEIDEPAWLQGKSMMPLITGEAEEINDAVFSEVTYHAAYEPQRGVRTKRWKYIRRFDGRLKPVVCNCDDSPGKELWMAHGWRERPVPQEQLYDLIHDPHEACNVAVDPTHASVLAEMRLRLDGWMQETHDPLLAGPIPAPKGAKVNDVDSRSPSEGTRTVK